jgi:hypothetical protein
VRMSIYFILHCDMIFFQDQDVSIINGYTVVRGTFNFGIQISTLSLRQERNNLSFSAFWKFVDLTIFIGVDKCDIMKSSLPCYHILT